MAKEIPLTQGLVAIVDEADHAGLTLHRWSLQRCGARLYAARYISDKGRKRTIYMHRQILGVGIGQRIDHVNADGLDNRRKNLRVATQSENLANARLRSNNRSGLKGVSWSKERRLWEAKIRVRGKTIHLGRHLTPVGAALAYDLAAVEFFGEFARTNRAMGLL
jgi:hypothetical protein